MTRSPAPLAASLVVALIASLLLLPWLGEKDFTTRGEAREALVMQSIVRDGNWILPVGYGAAVPSKPPLMHWAGAALARVSGRMNEFASRFPSAIGSIVFLSVFCFFVSRRFDVTTGVQSASALLLSVEWFRSSQIARVDMTLSVLLAGGLLSLFAWWEKGLRSPPWLPVILFASATLTKGPVALVLPGLVCGTFLFLEAGAGKGRVARVRDAFAACLRVFLPALLIASIWYLLAFKQREGEFLNKFYYENVARFLGTMEDEPHKKGVLVFYLEIMVSLLPWSLFALWMLVPEVSRLRSRKWALKGLHPFVAFASICCAFFVLFFTIPEGKRAVYVLPACPFAVFLVIHFIRSALREEVQAVRFRRAFRTMCALIALVLVIVLLAGLFPDAFLRHPLIAVYVKPLTVLSRSFFYVACLAVLLGWSAANLFSDRPSANAALAWLFAVVLVAQASLVTPLTNVVSPREFSRLIAPMAGTRRLYSYGSEFYAISFYLGRPMERLEESGEPSGLVLLYSNRLRELESKYPGSRKILESSTGIVRPLRTVSLVELGG